MSSEIFVLYKLFSLCYLLCMENTYRLSMSLAKSEKDLLDKVKDAVEKRTGVSIPFTELVRLSLRTLAKQERVK